MAGLMLGSSGGTTEFSPTQSNGGSVGGACGIAKSDAFTRNKLFRSLLSRRGRSRPLGQKALRSQQGPHIAPRYSLNHSPRDSVPAEFSKSQTPASATAS